MTKKALSIILLTGIVLTACGGQPTPVTVIPTDPPATTAAAPATETPTQANIPVTGDTQTQETNTPTPTIIPTVFVPENAADCTNLASFVSDVTIPDNTPITAGAAFTKTWRIQNTGTCIWWSGYTLTHYSENAMSAPASVPLPVTNPGETADISVDLVAPSAAGTYRGNFVVKNPAELIMQIDEDSRLWLIINVTSAPTSTPTATGGTAVPGSGSPTVTTSNSTTVSASAACAFTVDVPRTQQVAAAINTYRSQNSLVAYTVNEQLAQAAQRHANDMACNKLFFHIGSDGSTPQTRVADTGYIATRVTENVQGNYPPYNPDQVVTWWKLDQTDVNHNRNMISTQYTQIGVGYAFFDNFGFYVVVFASP
jgi:uncharacterized protein YkwD